MIPLAGLTIGSGASLVVGIFGLIVVVAAAVAVARTSYMKAQVEGLRGDRDDQKERIERLEATVESEKLRADTAEARVKVLSDVATGRAELASITSLLEAHDRKTERMAGEILTPVKKILEAVKAP